MNRHETIPLPSLMNVLNRRERIAPGDARGVQPAGAGHICIQVFVFVQPDRMESADIPLMLKLAPEDAGDVPGRGNPVLEIELRNGDILLCRDQLVYLKLDLPRKSRLEGMSTEIGDIATQI